MEKNKGWVETQMDLLAPAAEWNPDSERALFAIGGRMKAAPLPAPWRVYLEWSVAAAAIIVLLVMLPGTRLLAQQFWQFLTVGRVAVIHVNVWPEGVKSPQINLIGIVIPPMQVASLEEAREKLGYSPRLPGAAVLSGNPKVSVTGAMAMGTTLHNAELDLALQKVGITNEHPPAAWDGARLSLQTSRMMIAEWPNLTLVESLPLTIASSQGVDFADVSAMMLRILGVAPAQARSLADRMSTVPVWLLPVDHRLTRGKTIREIVLRSGPATLIEESDRVTIVWSVPDRVYLLTGSGNESLIIAAADSVR
jgi:hypothetical protein